MSIETAIYDRLSNFAGLAALVSTRIYPLTAPQDAAQPYLTYSKISETKHHASTADISLTTTRFEVSVWGATYATTKAAVAQVKAALSRYGGTNDSVVIQQIFQVSEVDFYEDDTKSFRVAVDFEIWFEA